MDLGDLVDLARHAQNLELRMREQFIDVRDQIAASRVVNAPTPAQHPPPAPRNGGWYEPAPPGAPQLPPPSVDPDEARSRLDEALAAIRALGNHLHNSSRLAHGIADMLDKAIPR